MDLTAALQRDSLHISPEKIFIGRTQDPPKSSLENYPDDDLNLVLADKSNTFQTFFLPNSKNNYHSRSKLQGSMKIKDENRNADLPGFTQSQVLASNGGDSTTV